MNSTHIEHQKNISFSLFIPSPNEVGERI